MNIDFSALKDIFNRGDKEYPKPDKIETSGKNPYLKLLGQGAMTVGMLGAAPAIPMLRAGARSSIAPLLRKLLKKPALTDQQQNARFIADYNEGANNLFNIPVFGNLLRKHLQNRSAKQTGLDKFMTDHYLRFGSGNREAMKHWNYELEESLKNRLADKLKIDRNNISAADWQTMLNSSKQLRNTVYANDIIQKPGGLFDQSLWKGLSESQAIRDLGEVKDKHLADYLRSMAAHKAQAFQNKYLPLSFISPALVVGGGALSNTNS